MKKFIVLSLVIVSVNISLFSQDILIQHCGFTVSYCCEHGTATWVSWTLTKSHVKSASEPRCETFYPDPSVPSRYRVTSSDYTGSGYDRGHLCPAADMSWSPQAMHDCFYMTNICPQNPQLNRISWKQLETACRKWVLTEDTLYIVCGPVYLKAVAEPACPEQSRREAIGNGHKIDVPIGFYKVILSLRQGHAKAIGFYYENTSQKQSLQATVHTVDYIELLTGIDFFSWLDDSLENRLESHCDLRAWH